MKPGQADWELAQETARPIKAAERRGAWLAREPAMARAREARKASS